MPFHKAETIATYKKMTEGVKTMGDAAQAAVRFSDAFRYSLGLCDAKGRVNYDAFGMPRLRPDAPLKAGEVSMSELTEAIIGENWRDVLGVKPGRGSAASDWRQEMQGNSHGRRLLSEADSGASSPSAFMNVAAWSSAVSGLYGAQFIEGYNTPEFKLRSLFPDRKAEVWQGGNRLINILGPYEPLPAVGPGEEAPSLKLDAMWVEPSGITKYSGKIEILKETAEIDISGGQFLEKAKAAGEAGALREELNAVAIIIGTVNNFKMGLLADTAATAYNTYGPTINGTALTNTITNPANDVGAFMKSMEAMTNLRHPVSGWPINVDFTLSLVPVRLEAFFRSISAAESVSVLSQITGQPVQTAPGTFPNFSTNADNPYRGMFNNVVSSQWLDYYHKLSATQTDPNRPVGLGLTDANAYRWYRLNPAKFACRLVAWDLSVLDLSPNDYVMATRGILAGQVVSIASTMQVLSPWHIQRSVVA